MTEEGAVSRASELHTTRIKVLEMEDLVSSVRVLNAASYELLAVKNEQEIVVKAMRRVLGWLHQQIGTSPLPHQVNNENKTVAEVSVLKEILHVFLHWHKLQEEKAMNWRFWMLWTELGCSLDVLQCRKEVETHVESFAMLVKTSRPPEIFPTCNRDTQVAFSRDLWGAVVERPLYGASSMVFDDAGPILINVFLHWMTVAMREYEIVFLSNVATQFREHLAATSNASLLANAWLKFANVNLSAGNISNCATSVAVTVMTLSGVTTKHRTPEVVEYLESLSAATVDELSRGLFPHIHNPTAIVAMALGLAVLDDAKSPTTQLQSGNSTLLSQFALLRIVCLPLLSSQLNPFDDAAILTYQTELNRRLQMLSMEPSHRVLEKYSLRMTETCIEEMIAFFQTSRAAHLALVAAVQSVLSEDLFRTKVLTQLTASATGEIQEKSLLITSQDIVSFFKQYYITVAPILEILSSDHLVRAFLALSRLEFTRELCSSSSTNKWMQTVTQQLELALEQSTPHPETIFAPVLRSLAMHSMTVNVDIPPEINIITGCQTLAIGLITQRKLRILLFQCSALIDDALAVVFSGLYNVFEPADAFAHRFLGVCLTHLAQFTPLFTIFPHYLQVTLAAYPSNASRQDLTKTCGVIFGSLFYSEAPTMPSTVDDGIVETLERMVLWAIRKCGDRSSELLTEEFKIATETKATEFAMNKASEKSVVMDSSTTSDTDGLYLAGLVFELLKMAPMDILQPSAMEVENLLARWKTNPRVLRKLKSALFARISQNCEAEKRAWLAAWYIEIDNQYPVETFAPSRL